MWEQRSAAMLEAAGAPLEEPSARVDPVAGGRHRPPPRRRPGRRPLVPGQRRVHRARLRNPLCGRSMAAREAAHRRDTLLPFIERALHQRRAARRRPRRVRGRARRRPRRHHRPVPHRPDDDAVRRRRRDTVPRRRARLHRSEPTHERPRVSIVVGAGLAGLVATHELVKAGKRVLVVDQENRNNLGGQAFWSLGGLFFVDSPEQRRIGIKDSYELALQDWMGSAGVRPRARGPLAAPVGRGVRRASPPTEKREYLHDLGLRVDPDRRLGRARRRHARSGHGNSVPRFHLTWGTGPEVVRVFLEPVLARRGAGPGRRSRSATRSTS